MFGLILFFDERGRLCVREQHSGVVFDAAVELRGQRALHNAHCLNEPQRLGDAPSARRNEMRVLIGEQEQRQLAEFLTEQAVCRDLQQDAAFSQGDQLLRRPERIMPVDICGDRTETADDMQP